LNRVADFLRVEVADHAPDFIALCVEEDKGWSEIKVVHRGKFHAGLVLNVQANDVDLAAKFCFELVNDGLNCGAANSIWRLEFKENGCAFADHRLHVLCIFHERGLAWMKYAPGGNKPDNNDSEGQIVIPFWSICEQDKARHQGKPNCEGNKGVLVGY